VFFESFFNSFFAKLKVFKMGVFSDFLILITFSFRKNLFSFRKLASGIQQLIIDGWYCFVFFQPGKQTHSSLKLARD